MPAVAAQAHKLLASPIPAFIIKEIREALPAMVFFAVGFNLIVLTTQLILDDYGAQLAGFMVATMTALVVGKAVLVAKLLPIMRRFDDAPLIQPILFQSIVYWVVVFIARFLEKLIEYFFHGGRVGDVPDYVTAHFSWHRFAAVQIWIFALFLVFTTAAELNRLFGKAAVRNLLYPTLVAIEADAPSTGSQIGRNRSADPGSWSGPNQRPELGGARGDGRLDQGAGGGS